MKPQSRQQFCWRKMMMARIFGLAGIPVSALPGSLMHPGEVAVFSSHRNGEACLVLVHGMPLVVIVVHINQWFAMVARRLR
jgi:hypothetical protein